MESLHQTAGIVSLDSSNVSYSLDRQELSSAADEVMAQQRYKHWKSEDGRTLLFDYLPPALEIIVFGAGPEAVPLAALARTLGCAVTIVDERPGYQSRYAFPARVHLTMRSIEQLRAELKLGGRSACVIATHNAAYDQRALRLALSHACSYIGLLGPRTRCVELIERLRASGDLRPGDAERIYSPIGLDVGTETPEQIALAIISEIHAVFSNGTGGFLRNHRQPLHIEAQARSKTEATMSESSHRSIAAIVLAAGGSTRMGRPKQLLTYGGRTFLRKAAETAIASGCHPIIVILGAYANQLHSEIEDLPVRSVVNERWAEGLGASICAGLGALKTYDREDVIEAVVLLLCDQPFVTATVIEELVAAYRSNGKGIIASEYGGTMGVPALFGREYFAELALLSGAAGAKQIIAAHALDVVRVPFPQGTTDIDTPEDYLQLQRAILPLPVNTWEQSTPSAPSHARS